MLYNDKEYSRHQERHVKGPEMETHMEDLTNSKEANGKFSGVRAEESLQDLPESPAYCSCSANSAVLH